MHHILHKKSFLLYLSHLFMSIYYRQMKTEHKLTDPHLLSQLEKIGLHTTDASLYLASIHLWACTINQLSTQTWLHRITVHDSVARLITKWLLLETFSGKRRLIFPQQINNLQHLVDLKKAEVDTLQHDVSTTIWLLQSLHLQASYLPQIRITKWRTGIEEMLREIKESPSSTLQIISDSWHFDELLTIHFLDSIKAHTPQIQMLLPSGFEHFIFSAHAKGVPIHTKTINEHASRTGGMSLRGNKVALHAYEGVYITTTIIENTPIAQMMGSCFQSMRDHA